MLRSLDFRAIPGKKSGEDSADLFKMKGKPCRQPAVQLMSMIMNKRRLFPF